MSSSDEEPRPPEEPLPALSWPSTLFVLAVALAVFVGLNPDWERLDIAQADANILWSYAPIPPLVLVLLALERKLRLASFALETLKLLMIKFAITYLAANLLWVLVAPPLPVEPAPGAAVVRGGGGALAPRAAPEPTPIDPARTRSIVGRVVDADGRGVPDLAVWVAEGLEDLAFAVPPEPVELLSAGRGFEPRLTLLPTWRRLLLRREGTELHTARGTDEDGREVFHYPALSAGGRELMFDRPLGPIRIACTVHGSAEPAAWVVVVGSPHAALTGADGGFELRDVPDGARSLDLWAPGGTRRREALGAHGELRLRWP